MKKLAVLMLAVFCLSTLAMADTATVTGSKEAKGGKRIERRIKRLEKAAGSDGKKIEKLQAKDPWRRLR